MDKSAFPNGVWNDARLKAFGFRKGKSGYAWSTDLLDGKFRLEVSISGKGEFCAQVLDAATNEEYLPLHAVGAVGAFVGEVRSACEAQVQRIREACFEKQLFRGDCATLLLQESEQKYHVQREFLWERYPEFAVLRRSDNAKWFALFMVLPNRSLKLKGEGRMEVVNVCVKPGAQAELLDGRRYFPAYHMNKEHWLTLNLDGSIPLAELRTWMAQSYQLAGQSQS